MGNLYVVEPEKLTNIADAVRDMAYAPITNNSSNKKFTINTLPDEIKKIDQVYFNAHKQSEEDDGEMELLWTPFFYDERHFKDDNDYYCVYKDCTTALPSGIDAYLTKKTMTMSKGKNPVFYFLRYRDIDLKKYKSIHLIVKNNNSNQNFHPIIFTTDAGEEDGTTDTIKNGLSSATKLTTGTPSFIKDYVYGPSIIGGLGGVELLLTENIYSGNADIWFGSFYYDKDSGGYNAARTGIIFLQLLGKRKETKDVTYSL